MKDKILLSLLSAILFLLLTAAREPESRLQQISTYVDEIGYQLHHHKVEIDLFHERLQTLETTVHDHSQEISKIQSQHLEGTRLRHIEEEQKAFLADLKNLKTELMHCINKQSQLEKSLHTQLKELQINLQKALALLGTNSNPHQEENYYIVKPGDSLGLIAQNLKISLKSLKEANQLSNDNIYVGQKLRLP